MKEISQADADWALMVLVGWCQSAMDSSKPNSSRYDNAKYDRDRAQHIIREARS